MYFDRRSYDSRFCTTMFSTVVQNLQLCMYTVVSFITELSAVITSSISVLVTLTTVIVVLAAIALIYFAGTRYKRNARRELVYDIPYNYQLPPLPPRIKRMDSGLYDTISNASNDGVQDQPQAHAQRESKSLDGKVVSPDSKIFADNSCTSMLNNSPISDENDNTVDDNAISQFPATSSDAVVNASSLPPVHSVETDLSSEKANGIDLPLNLEAGEESTSSDEFRIPSPNVTVNVSYQPSTNFSPERNPAYGTNVAIAPEINTSENIAYEHSDSNNIASSTGNTDSVTM